MSIKAILCLRRSLLHSGVRFDIERTLELRYLSLFCTRRTEHNFYVIDAELIDETGKLI